MAEQLGKVNALLRSAGAAHFAPDLRAKALTNVGSIAGSLVTADPAHLKDIAPHLFRLSHDPVVAVQAHAVLADLILKAGPGAPLGIEEEVGRLSAGLDTANLQLSTLTRALGELGVDPKSTDPIMTARQRAHDLAALARPVEDPRVAALELENGELRRANGGLVQDVQQLSPLLHALQDGFGEIMSSLGIVPSTDDKANAAFVLKAIGELKLKAEEVDGLRKTVGEKEDEIKRLGKELEKANSGAGTSIQEKNEEIGRLEAQLLQVRQSYTTASEDLRRALAAAKTDEADLQIKGENVSRLDAEVKQKNGEIERLTRELESANEQLGQLLQTSQATASRLEADVRKAEGAKGEAERKLGEAEKACGTLRLELDALRSKHQQTPTAAAAATKPQAVATPQQVPAAPAFHTNPTPGPMPAAVVTQTTQVLAPQAIVPAKKPINVKQIGPIVISRTDTWINRLVKRFSKKPSGESHTVAINKNCAFVSHVGRNLKNRPINEDCEGYLRLSNGSEHFVVADGMGGHGGGDVASKIAIQAYLNAIQKGRSMESAVLAAHYAVIKAAADGKGNPNMGATFIAAYFDHENNKLRIVHLADTRAKVVDVETGEGAVLTKDNGLKMFEFESQDATKGLLTVDVGGEQFPKPVISDEDYAQFESYKCSRKNIIFEGLLAKSIKPPQLFVTEIPLIETDQISSIFALYCDGLPDGMKEDQVTRQINGWKNENPKDIASSLVTCALDQGSKDNISVGIVKLPYRFDLGGIAVVQYKFDASSNAYVESGRLDPANRVNTVKPVQTGSSGSQGGGAGAGAGGQSRNGKFFQSDDVTNGQKHIFSGSFETPSGNRLKVSFAFPIGEGLNVAQLHTLMSKLYAKRLIQSDNFSLHFSNGAAGWIDRDQTMIDLIVDRLAKVQKGNPNPFRDNLYIHIDGKGMVQIWEDALPTAVAQFFK